jgi:hypothetical protein
LMNNIIHYYNILIFIKIPRGGKIGPARRHRGRLDEQPGREPELTKKAPVSRMRGMRAMRARTNALLEPPVQPV